MRFSAFFVAAACALLAGHVQAAPVPKDCWGKLKGPLERGGYSYFNDCKYYFSVKVDYVGKTNGKTKYTIYVMYYALPAVTGGPGHGGGKIFIFDEHMNYLGYYVLSDAFNGIWLKGSTVHFAYPRKWGNVLKLDGPEPPKRAWFLGDTVSFGK